MSDTSPWRTEHPLSLEQVARLLGRQFPSLRDASVRVLREGWESTAYLVDETVLFRFPKRADVEPMLQRELRLLPELRRHLSIPIPDVQFVGVASEEFPLMFAGYPLIAGTQAVDVDFSTVPRAALAVQLGRFLREVHTFDRTRAEALLVTANCGWRAFPSLRQRVYDALPTLEKHGQATAHIRAFFEDGSLFDDAARAPLHLLHNDFSSQHIILNASHDAVVGVIDFGDVDLGDAAVDFAGVYHWGGRSFAEEVLTHYALPTDATFLERARWVTACLGVYGLQFGLESARPEEVKAAKRALQFALVTT